MGQQIMAWEIVSSSIVKDFIRVPQSDMQDIWYDMAVGLIEEHTGWNLTATLGITEKTDGNGTDFLAVQNAPIASVASVKVEGDTIPSGYYHVRWDSIRLLSYRGEDVSLYNGLYSITHFPFGVGNIEIVYDGGGATALPNKYLQSVKSCILMVCKEFSTNFRGEGSDQMYRKYRPDRTQNPEEVLLNYGQHGKITGILKAFLPTRKNFA